MNASQLKCMIRCDPILNERVIDVYAADQLPNELPQTAFGLIANTDIHTRPGEHWCAFYRDIHGHVDFFDTYGRTPSENSQYFLHWLDINAKTVQTNHVQIQSEHSTLCGLYCVLFLHQRFAGHSYRDFLNLFDDSNLDVNDNFVTYYMCQAFSQCIGDELHYNQSCTSLMKCF